VNELLGVVQVLYRVALALFKMAAPALMQTDNPGDFLMTMRGMVQTCFDRDALMKVCACVCVCLCVGGRLIRIDTENRSD
jgi:hypothetical protein